MAGELISLKEAQEYLRVSNVTIWKLVKDGSLTVYADPLDKRKKLVSRVEVEKLKQPQIVKKGTLATVVPPPSPAPGPKAEMKKPETKTLTEVKAEVEVSHNKIKAKFRCVECGETGTVEFEQRGLQGEEAWYATCPKCRTQIVREKKNLIPVS